jgi:hypothetical protein
VESVVAITVGVDIDHQLHATVPDGDDTNAANDHYEITQNINIGIPAP